MNTTMSLFCQILSLIDKHQFQHIANQYDSDKGSKGFSTWNQFVSMLFCHLAQAKSLREISYGLKSAGGRLSHLGISSAPSKSNLSYANARRPWQVYQHIFHATLNKCQEKAPGKKKHFRFKNKLYSLDATVIDLCLSLFPWAKFRQTKGAVKLHLLLDHEGYLPVFAHITEGCVHEVNVAKGLELPKGSIITMDRAYTDYRLFQKWTEEEVFFVCRLKDNAQFRVIQRRKDLGTNIKADWTTQWTGFYSKQNGPMPLRIVKVWNPEKREVLEFVTNIFHLSASTIAAIYKDRWEIELFFKCLKQNLKIKTFVGTTPNALRVQIWTALIGILLLKFMKYCSKASWSMSNLAALIRMNLMVYADLWGWLEKLWLIDDPGQEDPQLVLNLGQHPV